MSSNQQNTSNYKPLQIKKFATKAFRDTPENKFWKKFDNVYQENYNATIKCVHSGNNEKNLISFTDGQTVQIYDASKKSIKQSFKNFKSEVTGITLRKDGNLIATGEYSGHIKVYDIKRKSQLRLFKNHSKAVHALTYADKDSYLFSGSDDLNLRQFDVAGGTIVRTLPNAHQDFIRSIQCLPNTGNNVLSSSYDFKINLFDFNANSNTPQMVFDHGHPVEDISVISSGFQFVSVGDTYTTSWDIRTGKVLEQQNSNQKTITSVQYLSSGDRFITGSLDNHLKIYRTDTFSVTHQYKLPNPIMDFDFSNDTQTFLVGLSDGQVLAKANKRKLGDDQDDSDDEKDNEEYEDYGDIIPNFLKGAQGIQSQERINSYKYFNRGIYAKPENYDLKYEDGKRKKLNQFDKFIKKFQYRDCIMTAFRQNQADILASLYEEFIQRGCLKHSLSNLEEEELQLVFDFLEKKIVNPKYADMCIDITNIMTELYQCEAETSLQKLGDIIQNEVDVQKNLLQLEGTLETIINTNLLS